MPSLVLDGSVNNYYHWVHDSRDYIIVVLDDSIQTYRLWWESANIEKLPAITGIRTGGFSTQVSFFKLGTDEEARDCFVVSSGFQTGRRDSGDDFSLYFPIYCWDEGHDTWDLAIRIPSEGAFWAHHFYHADDDINYIVTASSGHHESIAIHTYEIILEDTDEVHIWSDIVSPDLLELWKDHREQLDKQHDNDAVSITALVFIMFMFLMLIFVVFTMFSKGGGGSGGGSGYAAYQ